MASLLYHTNIVNIRAGSDFHVIDNLTKASGPGFDSGSGSGFGSGSGLLALIRAPGSDSGPRLR